MKRLPGLLDVLSTLFLIACVGGLLVLLVGAVLTLASPAWVPGVK